MSRIASIALAAVLAVGAIASAEDLPAELAALDSADDAARAAAVAALRARDDCAPLVRQAMEDAEAWAQLGPRGRQALVRLSVSADVPFVNASLRAIVRSDSEDTGVRRSAAEALGERGTIADVSALGDAVQVLPEAATRALVSIGGRSARRALERGAGDSPPVAARAGLALMGDATQFEILVDKFAGADAEAAADLARLLTWATGHELPAERRAWETHLRRRNLATQLAHDDLRTAQTAAHELSAVLASKTSSSLESDLIAILSDERWPLFARGKSALVLGLGNARGAKDALLHAVRNGEEGSVRLYAAEALARVGDLSCAVPLAYLLIHDEDRDRIQARRGQQGEYFPVDPGMVRALLRIGVPGAADPLLDLLAGTYRTRMHRDVLRTLREATGGEDFGYEADSAVADREAAVARARGWWAEGRRVMGLSPRAADPGWDSFRKAVDEQIATLGTFKFLHQLRAKKTLIIVAEPALPQLVAALSHDDLHVRMGAAEVLRGARLGEGAEPLAERLGTETNPVARSRFLWALSVCGRREAFGGTAPESVRVAVRTALQDAALDARIAAARALGAAGDPAVDPAVLEAAKGRSENAVAAFQSAAAGALLRLGVASSLDAWDVVRTELLCDDAARAADALGDVRAAGYPLIGFDPAAPRAEREAALAEIDAVLRAEQE